MMNQLKRWLASPFLSVASLFRELLNLPLAELILRLTLLTLLLHGSSTAWLDVPLKVMCGFMLLSPTHYRDSALWTVICGLTWWINATDWLWIDNHKYLITYWVLACTLSVYHEQTKEILAWNGRVLVGLVFGFAAIWKMLAGEYWDGDFFYYTLLVDGRMKFFAHVVCGVSEADLAQAKAVEDMLQTYPGESIQASLPQSATLRAFSIFMAWWTIIIELTVALSFLLTRTWIAKWRDWLLLAFIASTYFFVPVLGFGYILTILGLAACNPEFKRAHITYLAVIVVLQLGQLPWESYVSELFLG